MEDLLLKLCLYIQLNNNACDKVLLGVYTNSNFQMEYNQIKNYSEARIKNYVEDNKKLVYTGVILGSGFDMYQKQEIKVSTPLKPICDSLNVDFKADGNDSVHMDWKWEF